MAKRGILIISKLGLNGDTSGTVNLIPADAVIPGEVNIEFPSTSGTVALTGDAVGAHGHPISEIVDLQTTLDGKLDESVAGVGGLTILEQDTIEDILFELGLDPLANVVFSGVETTTLTVNGQNVTDALALKLDDSQLDTDNTFAANSDSLIPSQKAVKSAIATAISSMYKLQGDWNANTNTPDISGVTTTGYAYYVTDAGTTNLGGITDWAVGDFAIKSATGWVKIDNSETSDIVRTFEASVEGRLSIWSSAAGKLKNTFLGATVSGALLTLAGLMAADRIATFPDSDITVAGSAAALTATRMPYATTGGLLTDSASITTDGTTISAGGFLTRPAATQDAVALAGRAGGTSSYVATLTPTTLTASRTATLPDADIYLSGSAAALTSGRVPYATTGGLLVDSASLVFDGTNLGIGTSSPATGLHLATTSTGTPRGIMSSQHSDGTSAARLFGRKSRGTAASPTAILSGDALMDLVGSGYDGTNFLEMAAIQFGSSGTISSTRVPTYMSFYTATDAAPSVLTERMRIDNAGNVGIGTAIPSKKFHVSDGVAVASSLVSVFGANDIIHSISNAAGGLRLIGSSNTAGTRMSQTFVRSRGTLDTPTAVVDGDNIGDLLFGGHDGSILNFGAGVFAYADGTPDSGTSTTPVRLSFVTGSNGSNRAERLKISAAGTVTVTTDAIIPTLYGSATTAGDLSLRGNSADLTTGEVKVLGTKAATTAGAGAFTCAGGAYFSGATIVVGGSTIYRTVGAASTDGLNLLEATAASAGNTVRWSPRLVSTSRVWDTSASQLFSFAQEVIPVSAASPTAKLSFTKSYAGAAYSEIASLSDTGLFSTIGGLDTSGNARIAGSACIGSTSVTIASRIHSYEDNTASGANNGVTIEQDGTGDAILQYLLTGLQRWTTGIDNSDSDSFKIATGAGLGTADRLTLTTTGNLTLSNGTKSFLTEFGTISGAANQPYFKSTDGYYAYQPATNNTAARYYLLPAGSPTGTTSKFEMFNTDFNADGTNYGGFNIITNNTNSDINIGPNRNGTGTRLKMVIGGDYVASSIQAAAPRIAFNTDDTMSIGLGTGNVIIGGATNNTTFEADGSMLMNGTATVFDDESASTLGLQQTGAGVSNNLTEGTTEFTTGSNLSDYVLASIQMKHAAKIGAVIFPHIHFFQTVTGMPNFLLQYRWQINGGAKTTAWTNLACNTGVFTYVSGTLDQIAGTAAGITPPGGATISDIIQFRIIRDNANTSGAFAGADPVGATVGLTSFDIHVEFDRLGSRQEYVK